MSKRIGLRHISAVIRRILLVPSANNYDNVLGTIWSQLYGAYDTTLGTIWSLSYGAYDNHLGGQISISDPSAAITPQWGGAYDNRA